MKMSRHPVTTVVRQKRLTDADYFERFSVAYCQTLEHGGDWALSQGGIPSWQERACALECGVTTSAPRSAGRAQNVSCW
jgi:hypothetical protein